METPLEAESEAYQAGFGLAADTIEAVEEAGLRPGTGSGGQC